ncbi:MAG: antibiotic biosynthesis monooxygenase [Ilumatobacteraceae bacterium]
MIIVSGKLYVEPALKDDYLHGCVEVIEQARAAPGCIDFHISADALEDGRLNVYEQWDSTAAVEAFRGGGPSDEQTDAIVDTAIFQHEVTSSRQL